MRVIPIMNTTRVRLLILALIVGITGCGQEKVVEEQANETSNTETMQTTSNGFAYVTSQKSNTAGVSVIDLATMEVVKTFDLKAEGPRGLGITDDGSKLIVATRENSSISVMDTATGELLQQIEVGKNPEFVRVRGNFVFISSEPSAVGGPPPKPGTAEEEEEDDDEKIPALIAIVDLAKGEKIREIVGGPETEGIEFSADGKEMVITNEADNTITVHNIETGELTKTILTHQYGDRPRGIKISPDGQTYVATLEYGNKFMVLDKNFNFLRTVDTGKVPYGVSFDASGEYIYVAANKEKALQVFDAKSYEKVKDIPIGDRCWHFSFTPDDKQLLLACGKSDAIFVIDTEKQTVTKEIPVTDMPWGVVTYPKSMGSLDTKL
ncbi:MAG: beta-propeller fold lactonase family protein [Methylophilaceae bacterium]|nr:beta-propeller fold lactonase family protein [Methylophilaceae bacterium]